MDEPHWVKRFTDHGATGAYLRVVEGGTIGAGDEVTVVSRPDARRDRVRGLLRAAHRRGRGWSRCSPSRTTSPWPWWRPSAATSSPGSDRRPAASSTYSTGRTARDRPHEGPPRASVRVAEDPGSRRAATVSAGVTEQESVGQLPPSVGRMFLDRVAATPGNEAYRRPVGDSWESMTWGETGERVAADRCRPGRAGHRARGAGGDPLLDPGRLGAGRLRDPLRGRRDHDGLPDDQPRGRRVHPVRLGHPAGLRRGRPPGRPSCASSGPTCPTSPAW